MAQMMIKCKAEITEDQADLIQTFRTNTASFKNTADYEDLIAINWEALRHKPEPVKEPVAPKKEEKKAKRASLKDDPDAEEKGMLDDEEAEIVEEEPVAKPAEPEAPKEVRITLTDEERIMATEIEDISEDLHAEQVVSNKAGAGKTSIAFMDPNSMGLGATLLYMLFFMSFFAAVGYFFYSNLFNEEQDPRKLKRDALNQRRAESD